MNNNEEIFQKLRDFRMEKMIELKNTIHYIDQNAFITIMDVSEVKGKGFKNI